MPKQQAVKDKMQFLKENWLKVSMDVLQGKTGFTTSELYYYAYSELRLPRRSSHSHYIDIANITNLYTRADTGLGIPRAAVNILGYGKKEAIPVSISEDDSHVTVVLEKKQKK